MNIFILLAKTFWTILEAFVLKFVPVKRKSVRGEVVLVTGAAHGVGRCLALEFGRLGATVVLWDINRDGNEATAEQIREDGGTARAYRVDCSKREEIQGVAQQVKEEVGDVTVLFNNAGVMTTGSVLDLTDDQIERTFQVNVLAHFWTIRAFLPSMMTKNHGHIAALASIAGYSGSPYMVDYTSSKHAVVGLMDTLQKELELQGKDGIKTTTVCPFFIDTGFCPNPKIGSTRGGMRVLSPEEVALEAVDAVLKNKRRLILPPELRSVPLTSQLLPYKTQTLLQHSADISFDLMQSGQHNKSD
ncbi:estradiol 17-beta-dehydrogenase 11-like [Branchiostoma floridae]|uniref:Short-chain dehydrogenase/reductase 3 n=1 Tax=Branchiostoma floridae TaxID=7739 RepID=A0A9J7MIV7_BRAFL|nr:estradiol 17-beta-dehydrogenase 11-like [Branchiostoma floridae]